MALRPLNRELIPPELHAAYDGQRDALLRRRTLWVLGVFLFFELTAAGMVAITHIQPDPGSPLQIETDARGLGPRYWALLAGMIVFAMGMFVAVWQRWRRLPDWPTVMALVVAGPAWITILACLMGLNPRWYEAEPWFIGVLAAMVFPWSTRDAFRALVLVAAGAIPAAVLFAITDRAMAFTSSRAMATLMMPGATLIMLGATALLRRPRQRELVIEVLASASQRQELPRPDRWPCGQAVAGDYIRAAEMRAAYAMESARLFSKSLMRFLAGAGGLCIALALARLAMLRFTPEGVAVRDLILDPTTRGVGNVRAMISASVPFDLALGAGLVSASVMLLWSKASRATLRTASSVIIALAYCTSALEAIRIAQLSPDTGLPMVICAMGLGLWTLLASILLPWTVSDALRTVLLSVVSGGMVMYVGGMLAELHAEWKEYVLVPVAACVFSLPAVVGAALRQSFWHRQFQAQYVEKREREFRDELTYARRLHESLFPLPLADGTLRLAFRYEPMRQLGGDFLFVQDQRSDPHTPALSLVVIDVTGHGIPAAITVAQLAGELRRIYAEKPAASPDEVLASLNRYMGLTVATHSVYATAFCARVEPRSGRLRFASAGHPPAFLRRVTGKVEELESTTFVLGVAKGNDFEAGAVDVPFEAGDALVVFTDGAPEARDAQGRMLRLSGMRDLVRRAMVGPHLLPEWLLQAVRLHRAGQPEDDTLVATIYRTPETSQVETSLSP